MRYCYINPGKNDNSCDIPNQPRFIIPVQSVCLSIYPFLSSPLICKDGKDLTDGSNIHTRVHSK